MPENKKVEKIKKILVNITKYLTFAMLP